MKMYQTRREAANEARFHNQARLRAGNAKDPLLVVVEQEEGAFVVMPQNEASESGFRYEVFA